MLEICMPYSERLSECSTEILSASYPQSHEYAKGMETSTIILFPRKL